MPRRKTPTDGCPECARLEERLRLMNASLQQANETNAKLLVERTERERVAAELLEAWDEAGQEAYRESHPWLRDDDAAGGGGEGR